MTTKTLLSLATVALLAATSQATTVETTTNWFETVTATTVDGWTGVTPTRENNLIKVDTTADAPTFYTAGTAPSASRIRVVGTMKVTLNASAPDNNVFGNEKPQAALIAVAGGQWYGWHLTDNTGNGTGAWVGLCNTNLPTEDEQECTVKIEFTSAGIAYYVGNTKLGDTLTNAASMAALTKIGLAGYGSFSSFSGFGIEEFDFTISDSDLKDMGIDTEGDIAAQLQESYPNGNGIPRWESYVLGLDCKDPDSKPFAQPVQNTSANTLTFTLGGVAVNAGADATVKFTVVDANTGIAVSSETDAGNEATVTLPTAEQGVKYYKISVKISK